MQRLWAIAVQPGPQREVTVVAAQAGVGADEDLLDGVLGIGAGAGEHLTRVGEQPRPVAVMDDPEGLLVAGAEERDQLLVGAQSQERHAKSDSRSRQSYRWECGGFH